MVFNPRYIVETQVVPPYRLHAVSTGQTTADEIMTRVCCELVVLCGAVDDQGVLCLVVPGIFGQVDEDLRWTVHQMSVDVQHVDWEAFDEQAGCQAQHVLFGVVASLEGLLVGHFGCGAQRRIPDVLHFLRGDDLLDGAFEGAVWL